MKDKLAAYVDLLFAGAQDASDIKQEILQNTLDRYDDLIEQGKAPEAAYRLAISGIGDINEILGTEAPVAPIRLPSAPEKESLSPFRQLLKALAIMLYILCPVPLFLLQNELGLCALLGIVAVATALLIFAGFGKKEQEEQKEEKQGPLEKSIHSAVSSLGLAVYFIVSFLTGAWHITWIIFLVIGAINGLIRAIFDYGRAES